MKKKKNLETLEDSFAEALEGKVPGRSAGQTFAKADSAATPRTAGSMAGISFEVSHDAVQVVMRANGAAAAAPEQIVGALQEQRVVFGIDKAAVHVAADRIAKAGGWQGDLVIARGTPPENPYVLDYPFLEPAGELGAKNCSWLVDGIPLFPHLARLFSLKSLSELEGFENIAVKVVGPKDVIVRIVRQGPARPGRNVHGEEIKAEGFPLQIGSNISYDAKECTYVSDLYGYLLAEGNHLAVLEPVWVSPDRMAAYYINLPQPGLRRVPTREDLVAVLLQRGVNQKCLRNKVIAVLCDRLKAGENLRRAVKIAAGVEPKRGFDADIRYSIDFQKRAGTIRGDNSIDLRERNAVVHSQQRRSGR